MLNPLLQLAQATSLFGLILLVLGWYAPRLERLAPTVQIVAWGSILGALGALSGATSIDFHGGGPVDPRGAPPRRVARAPLSGARRRPAALGSCARHLDRRLSADLSGA